jgi:hypothetical protein
LLANSGQVFSQSNGQVPLPSTYARGLYQEENDEGNKPNKKVQGNQAIFQRIYL